jgi:hypothetical protein
METRAAMLTWVNAFYFEMRNLNNPSVLMEDLPWLKL